MARPRDPDLDRRIIETFRSLAERDGLTEVSISAVSEASGVSRSAIYRRWPSVAALRFEAQTSRSVDGGFPDHGSLRADLIDAVERLVGSMVDGDRKLTGEMLGQMIADEGFSASVWRDRWGPDTEAMMPMWERAVARGDVPDDVDGTMVMDQLVSMCIYQVMLLHRSFDEARVAAYVDGLLDGLAAG